MGEVKHKLLPKQAQVLMAPERHRCYSGAVGAGKSRLLCIVALVHVAGRPNARFGLFRKTLVALRKSTLKTLLEGDGNAPPVLPPGQYTHNKNECEIRVNGGGSILYSGIETPESVQSMNLSGAGVDEVTELQANDYNAVDDRVRLDIGLPLQVTSATNPGTPSHWLARMMGLSPEKTTPDPNCRLVLTRTPDNTYLPADYLASFARHEGSLYYRRMYLGEWCGSEGLVYDGFSRDRHVRTMDGEADTVYLGVDEGYTDPFTVLEVKVFPDNHLHVSREVYEPGLVEPQKIRRVRKFGGEHADTIVDSAAPGLIQSLRNAGVQAFGCEKGPDSIEFGVNLVRARLAAGSLTVDPCCTNTIREFESYELMPRPDGLKEKPRDLNNHALDPLRYVVRHVDGTATPPVAAVGESGADSDDHMWSDAGW